jgi:hypothetical protein
MKEDNNEEKIRNIKSSFGYFCSHRHDVGGIPKELESISDDHKVFLIFAIIFVVDDYNSLIDDILFVQENFLQGK